VGRNRAAAAVAVLATFDSIRVPELMDVVATQALALVRVGDVASAHNRVSFTVPGDSYFAVTGIAKRKD